jgi:transcriptional regulator with XRE-family HTH domain
VSSFHRLLSVALCDPFALNPCVRDGDYSAVFSAALRAKRFSLGLSQELLAEKAGLHPTYIGLIERGKRSPTLRVAQRLAQALGCDLSALLKVPSRRPRGERSKHGTQ